MNNQQPQQQQQQPQQVGDFNLNITQGMSFKDCVGRWFYHSTNPDKSIRVNAEKELEKCVGKQNFGVVILQIVAEGLGTNNNTIEEQTKICAAIYFKRLIQKHWCREEQVISNEDRKLIQQHLIQVMFGASQSCQRQLSETISTIANYDFQQNWQTLKPTPSNEIVGEWQLLRSLVDEMNPQRAGIEQATIVLNIIRSITNEHVGKDKNIEMITQIKYIVKQFIVKLWINLFKAWIKVADINFNRSLDKPPPQLTQNNLNQVKLAITGMEPLILIFYDLVSIDLIEYFEDNIKIWSQLFLSILNLDDKFGLLSREDDQSGPIDKLRTAVMKSVHMFASNYEEESSPVLRDFVSYGVSLLSTLDDKERYDLLVAETTNFLTIVVKQRWNHSMFDTNKLDEIVSGILIRNIKLRDSDINMYEMNGEEWVLRDMEGSDFCTRRRGALDLLRKLCEVWPMEIGQIVNRHVNTLLQRYSSNKKINYVDFDTAINLFLATNVMGETKADGATKLLNGDNTINVVKSFLNANIMPYLQNQEQPSHELISADCLKYTIMFRSHYPQQMFEQLVSLACTFLRKEDYVTHTYAAIALDRILTMRKKMNNNNIENGSTLHTMEYKYPKEQLILNLKIMLEPLFIVLTKFQDSFENEYVMKAIMKVVVRAEEATSQFTDIIVNHMLQIIERVSKNPSKPTFNHYMFEIVAACIHYSCKNDQKKVEPFERVLIPIFQIIVQNDACSEFHPYVFQIVSLMLRIRNQVTPKYIEIYDAMLKTDRWLSEGNIISISSMFGDFYKILSISPDKFNIFMKENDRLISTLGIYQHLISKRTHDIYAFRVLSALFEYCPLNIFEIHIKQILEIVFARLRAQKTIILCANFIKSLSIFILKHNFETIYNYCEKIQSD